MRALERKHKRRLGVALIGAGAFGKRRAAVVAAHPGCRLLAVADPVEERARAVAAEADAAGFTDWRAAIAASGIDVVLVATPTALAPQVALAALQAGKHVLAEKPFGRSADEILPCVRAARERDVILKVGYNHRYHPGIAAAHHLFRAGAIGRLLCLRCTYGHGGREGYEREWRSQPEISGGGQLLDQGVHALDLFRWFAGEFIEATASLATAYWPIAPVEDNVFALLRTPSGVIAQLHASWTQWKNSFSLEVGGDSGALVVTGLGRSYGPERMVWQTRSAAGRPPEEKVFSFPEEDASLQCEWEDFLEAIGSGLPPMSCGEDAWRTLGLADALYQSARQRRIIPLDVTTITGASLPAQLAACAAGELSR
jgi:predicted dehydrogenase